VSGPFGLPEWLVVGIALGLASSVLVALLFFVADRRYPTEQPDHTDGGEERRRTEIRQYLDAIGEEYVERHRIEGEEVAFYLPERDVAVTFDVGAFYRIDRSDTYAVLVEHEMPGFQLGSRLPFEVPEVAFDDGGPGGTPSEADADADTLAAALAELGVGADADGEEIRAAYRRRVKETHPDQGGDEEEFKRVREAYVTAKRRTG
jgi:hypothetical protein